MFWCKIEFIACCMQMIFWRSRIWNTNTTYENLYKKLCFGMWLLCTSREDWQKYLPIYHIFSEVSFEIWWIKNINMKYEEYFHYSTILFFTLSLHNGGRVYFKCQVLSYYCLHSDVSHWGKHYCRIHHIFMRVSTSKCGGEEDWDFRTINIIRYLNYKVLQFLKFYHWSCSGFRHVFQSRNILRRG